MRTRMSVRAKVPGRAKTGSPSASFAQPAVPVQAKREQKPHLETQVEGASRLGHRFGDFQVRPEQLSPTGGGRALPQQLRARMEAAFGTDFAGVRVHEGLQPLTIGARAYTQGDHIHFAPGAYQPGSTQGQRMLGHELTHVVQQRAGRVIASQGSGISISADPKLEQEADAAGAKVARGGGFGTSALGVGPAPIQVGDTGAAVGARLHTTSVASAQSTVIQPNGGKLTKEEEKLLVEMGEAAKKARAYHAAPVAKLLPGGHGKGILKEGLQPRFGGTGAAKQVGIQKFIGHSKGKVHFTTSEDTAQFYKSFLERKQPARILKIAMPKELSSRKEQDPDDPDPKREAYRLEKAIPPEYIRTTNPRKLRPSARGAKKKLWAPGKEGYEHQRRGDVELEALMSYMPEYEKRRKKKRRKLKDLTEKERTMLYMMRNALRAGGGGG